MNEYEEALKILNEEEEEKLNDKINIFLQEKETGTNRAQRRKATRNYKRKMLKNKGLIKDAAEKLAYIEMIEKIRKMRKEIEKNEQATYEED